MDRTAMAAAGMVGRRPLPCPFHWEAGVCQPGFADIFDGPIGGIANASWFKNRGKK